MTRVFCEHADLTIHVPAAVCLDGTTLSPRQVFEAAARDVEGVVYRHMHVLVAAGQVVSRARCRSRSRVACRFVVNDHVLIR
jgi:hypothetical protein